MFFEKLSSTWTNAFCVHRVQQESLYKVRRCDGLIFIFASDSFGFNTQLVHRQVFNIRQRLKAKHQVVSFFVISTVRFIDIMEKRYYVVTCTKTKNNPKHDPYSFPFAQTAAAFDSYFKLAEKSISQSLSDSSILNFNASCT